MERPFEYHLNHYRPPSLVPVTIQQQVTPSHFVDPKLNLGEDQLASGTSNSPVAFASWERHEGGQLAQLQLPLQLHLKLHPLPLPMPPPPNQKRRRDLPVETMTTNTETIETLVNPPVAATSPTITKRKDEPKRRADIMADTWQEAKRVLLLSAMPSALSKLERRTSQLVHSAPVVADPADLSQGDRSMRKSRRTSGDPPSVADEELASSQKGEVRRQRHSSQQANAQGQLSVDESSNSIVAPKNNQQDAGLQALATAMLPYLWPSYQLPNKLTTAVEQSQTSNRGSGSWPVKYTNLSRNNANLSQISPVAASNHLPTIVSLESDPQMSSGGQSKDMADDEPNPQVILRKKRRKPTYLAQTSPDSKPSTPYPDSTRIASRYPMPKIKFTAKPVEETPQSNSNSNSVESEMAKNPKPLGGKSDLVGQNWQPAQIPKILSKLIEHQLLANASGILLAHKQNSSSRMAPSTSISKVVHLRNNTDFQIIMSSTSTPPKISATIQRDQLHPKGLSVDQRSTKAPVKETSHIHTTTRAPETTREPSLMTTGYTKVLMTQSSLAMDTLESPVTSGVRATKDHTPRPERLTTPSSQDTKMNTPMPSEIQTGDSAPRKYGTKPTVKSTTERPVDGKPRKGQKLRSVLEINSDKQGKNIKLFHFKRKPDMNKLPFYKKPLNYTELGWTSEQIQEHLDSLSNFELEPTGANSSGTDDSSMDTIGTNSTLAASNGGDSPLLKRKRRGKNQFEKLMAELHGHPSDISGSNESEGGSGEDNRSDPSSGQTEPNYSDPKVPAHSSKNEEEHLVPVIRKKNEQLVMKPMFFVMNQKRRTSPSTPELTSEVLPATTTTPMPATNSSSQKGKPIIRMRRKHHGDQPHLDLSSQERLLNQAAWRPSKPLVSPALGKQLLLVPSSLLTPSGSHLMPLYAAQPVAIDPMSWREESETKVKTKSPNRPQRNAEQKTQMVNEEPSVVGQTHALQAQPPQGDQPEPETRKEMLNSGSLRVPKLLVKPMRPAKYSLNGYIPKPSLGQQHQSSGGSSSSGVQSASSQAVISGGIGSLASPKQSSSARRPKPQRSNGGANLSTSQSSIPSSSRDLDSATTNEIFSRRRGLQQHQRLASQPSATNSLVPATSVTPNTGHSSNPQRQMEENRRKYVLQQQHSMKSYTLSAQRANQIKEKLGLVDSNTGGLSAPVGEQPVVKTKSHLTSRNVDPSDSDHNPQATTGSISTLDPDTIQNNLASHPTPRDSTFIGAPLNAIPKTDFECTDKRGRFVSGLFADHKTGCQVWHLCSNNRKYSFLCPTGTIFNAKVRICDWRYNVKCENTSPF